MSATPEAGGRTPVRRALVSVYDKTGLEDLVTGLHAAGVTIVSTGSTAAAGGFSPPTCSLASAGMYFAAGSPTRPRSRRSTAAPRTA